MRQTSRALHCRCLFGIRLAQARSQLQLEASRTDRHSWEAGNHGAEAEDSECAAAEAGEC